MRKSDVLWIRRVGLAAAGLLTLSAGLGGAYYAITPETIGSVPTPQLGVLLAGLVLPGLTVGAVMLDRQAARRSRAARVRRSEREEAVASLWGGGQAGEGGFGAADAGGRVSEPVVERREGAVAGGRAAASGRRRRHGAGRISPAGLGG